MIGKKKVVTVQYPDRYKKLLLQNRRRDSVIYIETKNRSNYEGTEQLRTETDTVCPRTKGCKEETSDHEKKNSDPFGDPDNRRGHSGNLLENRCVCGTAGSQRRCCICNTDQ